MLQHWKLYVGAVLLLAAMTIGWQLRGLIADAQIAQMERAAAKQEAEDMAALVRVADRARQAERNLVLVSAQIDELTAKAQQAAQVKIKYVEREVIRYAEDPDRPVVVLPADWVRIHNDAAAGTATQAATSTCGPDVGTTSTAAATSGAGQRCAGPVGGDQ
jgi:hypothetical protein